MCGRRYHHERLDGRGYPRGVAPCELDVETRILTVCDVYDALVSARVYRPAWSIEDALALVRSEAGTAFDPRCVEVLIRVLGQNVGKLMSIPVVPRLSRAG